MFSPEEAGTGFFGLEHFFEGYREIAQPQTPLEVLQIWVRQIHGGVQIWSPLHQI
jgi:hypothetical protein